MFRNAASAVFVRSGSENERRARALLEGLGVGFPFTEFGAARGAGSWARANGCLPAAEIERLETLLARDDLPARLEAAERFARAGDLYLESAALAYARVVEAAPEHPTANFNLAMALAGIGKGAEASERLRRHLSVSPGDGQARALLRRLEGNR